MHILTLKMLGIIGKDYEDRCECGYYFDTSGSDGKYTTITCTNPTCPIESQYKITDMLEILGVKVNLGEEKAGMIVDWLMEHNVPYKSNLDLLCLDKGVVLSMPNILIAPLLGLQQAVKEINDNGGITLATYMSLWCFNGLGETYCKRIFSTYSSLKEFYDDILIYNEDGSIRTDMDAKIKGWEKIASFINMSFTTDTVSKIYRILVNARDDIIRCGDIFKIKKVSDRILQLCITGEVTRVTRPNGQPFKPRDTFGSYLSDRYNINVILNKSYSNIVNFVVMDKPSNSRKAKAAREAKRNDKKAVEMIREGIDPGCKLITSDELIKKIESGEI